MIALVILGMAGNVSAQGRGHQKGHERDRAGKHEKKDHHHEGYRKHDVKHDHHDRRHDGYRGHHHHPSDHRVVHRHERYHHHEPVVARSSPRYIFYRDYDVYYDLHRNVYISYSGRNWTISAGIPVTMRRADVHRAVRMEVDYDHDDFARYLERSRPSYRRIYTGS